VPFDREAAAETTTDLAGRLRRSLTEGEHVDRRTVLGGLGLAGGAAVVGSAGREASAAGSHAEAGDHGNFAGVGEYEDAGFDPHEFLTEFNDGTGDDDLLNPRVYTEEVRGEERTVRHFDFVAVRRNIQIAPGVSFTAWTYNEQVPGPTLRATEGDVVRITFRNQDTHAHTIHPHLRNLAPEMDGIPQNGPGVLEEDEEFTYQWLAQPAGMHFYHCHSLPLKEHIHRGLYGALIVDPDPERVRENPRDYVNYHGPITDDYRDRLVEQARRRHRDHVDDHGINEMVMVMNGFDTNFDGDNEVYAANTRAFAYGVPETDGRGTNDWDEDGTIRPIAVDRNELQRVYLLNVIEFDLVNSFHSHSQFFDYYDHGTTLYPTHRKIDTVMQCQAQRGILELDYSGHDPGLYMFHAHQSEFAELGWMSFFDVQRGGT
jgi:FtsP/CotA-like multicopper oxidase with cupredoxin domain